MNGSNHSILNTCTIDYFIIIMATVGKFNKHIKTIADNNLKSFIMDLFNYVYKKIIGISLDLDF